MKLNSYIVAAAIAAVFVVFVAGAGLAGFWKTESSKVPAKFASGDLAGQYNPADIRGSYSFADIDTSFQIDAKVILAAFGFDTGKDPASVLVKDLEGRFELTDGKELGTDSVRLFVALYLNLPYSPEDSTVLPAQAKPVLKERLTAEKFESISPLFTGLHDEAVITGQVTSGEASETTETEKIIKGKTTFFELTEWGLNRSRIISIVGKDNWTSGQTVRDWCTAEGIEFSGLKTILQEALDGL